MYTVNISEQQDGDGVVLTVAVDALPPHATELFPDAEAAKASMPTLEWTEVTDEMRADEEIDGDVLYVAYFA